MVPSEGPEGGSVPGLSLWLADVRLLPVSLRGLPSVRVCVPVSPFYEITSDTGSGPTHPDDVTLT